jgi:quercetin dioxygenase-like cupin family protein
MGGPAEIAILSGNPQTGPSSILLRFPPRYPGAMHSHSAGYHAIVIEGASKHWTENNDADSAPLQTPGDYWFQAGGQVHQDSFPSDEITTVFLRFEGPVDFFLAEK